MQAVQEYLRAQNDLENGTELKKVWTNTVLGQVFETPGQRVDEQGLKSRAEDYKLGTVPNAALILTAGVDVQGDRLEIVVKGWGRGEESWLIGYEQIFGDPAQEGTGSVWERLSDLLDRAWPHAGGSTLRIVAAGIDTGGHHTHEVYRYCRARERRHTIAVKGHSVAGKPILGRPSQVDINWRGKVIKQGVQLWLVGTDTAKSVLYNRLRLEAAGPGYLHFPVGLPDNYYDQLTAERRVTRFVKGFARSEWVKADSARNEALDCEVYAYAAAIYAGVSRANWERLEQVLAPKTADLFVGKVQEAEPGTKRPFIDPRQTSSWLRRVSTHD
jgi:phage terminase large subunit GpA-like protein